MASDAVAYHGVTSEASGCRQTPRGTAGHRGMQQGRKGTPRDAQGILGESWDYMQSPGLLGTLGEDSTVPPLYHLTI